MKMSRASLPAVLAVFLTAPGTGRAEVIYGVSVFNDLVSFDSASPGTILSTQPITGMAAAFESIAGIDFRPATGELYALGNAPGSQYRLYTLSLTTGVATQVGSGFLTFSSSATGFGFDFNPVADRIRVVNNAEENGRLNPLDGTYLADSPLTGGAGNVAAAGYTNNFPGAASTRLYTVDYSNNTLYEQVPPNAGTMTAVGALGVSLLGGSFAGLDISGSSGTAFLSDPDFAGGTTLYTVNLGTGAATSLGAVGSSLFLRDISVMVPEPGSLALTGAAAALALRRRRKGMA